MCPCLPTSTPLSTSLSLTLTALCARVREQTQSRTQASGALSERGGRDGYERSADLLLSSKNFSPMGKDIGAMGVVLSETRRSASHTKVHPCAPARLCLFCLCLSGEPVRVRVRVGVSVRVCTHLSLPAAPLPRMHCRAFAGMHSGACRRGWLVTCAPGLVPRSDFERVHSGDGQVIGDFGGNVGLLPRVAGKRNQERRPNRRAHTLVSMLVCKCRCCELGRR